MQRKQLYRKLRLKWMQVARDYKWLVGARQMQNDNARAECSNPARFMTKYYQWERQRETTSLKSTFVGETRSPAAGFRHRLCYAVYFY